MGNSLKWTLGVMSLVNKMLDDMDGVSMWNTMDVDRRNIIVRGQTRDSETGQFVPISLHVSTGYKRPRQFGYIINGKRHGAFETSYALVRHWNEHYADYYSREYTGDALW